MLININKSEEIIKKYYKILCYINANITDEFIIERLYLNNSDIKKQLDKNICGKFIIQDIKEEIIKMKYIYKISFEDNDIIIFSKNIIYKDSINLKSLIKIIKYLQKIGNKDILKAYFYLTDSKRIIVNNLFDARSVNGGYTSFVDKRMVVWRKEDGIKVFIHELIHYFNIDDKFKKYGDINNYSNKKITKNIDISSEAFTDFFAINFYMVYLSLIKNDFSIDLLYSNFCNQYNYSFLQGLKIIKYSQLSNNNLIENYTNVYSYYLLKLYLMIFYRNSNLSKINIKELINKSYIFYTLPLIKQYISKINLNNKINMTFKQIYL